MPQPVNYICTQCDFSGSDMNSWGAHYYIDANKRVIIDRAIAICYGCNSIVSAEILPNPDTQRTLNTDSDALGSKHLVEDLNRIKLLDGRVSPPRCLKCGSHDFEVFPPLKIPYPPPSHPIRSGLIHRVCGGRIYSEHDTPNLNFGNNLPERYFTSEGVASEIFKTEQGIT